MHASERKPRYDAIAKYYDRVMRPLEAWLFYRLRGVVFANIPEDAKLLEVGAGTGANFPFYPQSTRVVASEISFNMLELARAKAGEKRVQLVQTCAERLPFADDVFEAAVSTLVFCSVISPHDSFLELRRVVRPGGTIALLEHVRPSGLLGYLFDVVNLITVALFDDHINRRTADEAKRAGLKVVSVTRHAHGIVNVIVCQV